MVLSRPVGETAMQAFRGLPMGRSDPCLPQSKLMHDMRPADRAERLQLMITRALSATGQRNGLSEGLRSDIIATKVPCSL